MSVFEYHSSEIEWCENNYTISCPYIVEFFNTISNIPMFLLALYQCHIWYKKFQYLPAFWAKKTYFWLLHLNFILIPIFSLYFHATLSYFGQVADEMSILSLIIFLEKEWSIRVVKFLLSFITLYFCPSLNRLFLAVFGFRVAWIFYREIREDEKIEKIGKFQDFYHKKKTNFYSAIILFGFSTIFWIIDLFFCDYLWFSLHWIWHILSGLAIYCTIRFILKREYLLNYETLNQ